MFYMFFFKQKTAYEMRISDWSSDVCSSDLLGDQLLQARFLLRQPLAQRGELFVQAAVLERLPLGVADLPLGLDCRVLLGLFRLPRKVLQMIADPVAHVGTAPAVLAGVAASRCGFLLWPLFLAVEGCLPPLTHPP